MGLTYAALGLFALLSIFAAVISLPLDKPVDLGHTGAGGLDGRTGTWYTLGAGEYSIGPGLGSASLHGSFLPFISTRYTYYLVTVGPEGEAPFSMAVRVCGAKAERLARGEAVALYGMASGLTGAQAGQAAGLQTAALQYRCLNDNGDTAAGRALKSIAFFLIAALCVFLIVKIARRP